MAVVTLSSAAHGERLVERLMQDDDAVELAVPDTWVTAFDFGAGGVTAASLERSLRGSGGSVPSEAQCSAHAACRLRGLVGDCCPATDGMMLSCCSARGGPNLFALRSYHGTFLEASADGRVQQVLGDAPPEALFDLQVHGNGTFALRSYFGKYMVVDEQSNVFADRSVAQAWERFNIALNWNGTITLQSHLGTYLSADEGAVVLANRSNATFREQFTLVHFAAQGERLSNDPNISKLWGMKSYEGFDIDAPEAWKIWTGEVGDGITVAVLDTGIDYTHPDLSEQMWVNPLEIPDNGVDDDENGYIDDVHGADFVNDDGDPMDDQMHGTHCAGTIAGVGNNGVGVAGVAWRGVRLMALKFLDSSGAGRTSDAIRAIDYAVAQGAKIASNSWGGGGSNPALQTAIEYAEAAGMLFTAAAGNGGADNDLRPNFPANYNMDNVISVAATTRKGELAHFSCFGSTSVDLAAPGDEILSTIPGGGYGLLSGTSMATPHVSGLAALVWMYRPGLSMRQVRDVLLGSVRRLPALEGKTVTGGLINAKDALESTWAFAPPSPPKHAARGIEFEDVDQGVGSYAGTITIAAAADESDIEYYRVFFVSGAGFQLQALGHKVPATGAAELTMEINASFVPPKYAKYLVVVAGRAAGEMHALLNGIAPHVELKDFALPDSGPSYASWGGDRDLREGWVSGELTVGRAESEHAITSYNVYWSTGLGGVRGPLVGKIPGTGRRAPSCAGKSCGLLGQRRTTDGGWRFARRPYGGSEQATIAVSGPGRLEFDAFDTERYYDALFVDGLRVSGNLSATLPHRLDLPEGLVNIQWQSDESLEATGWSFVLYQSGITTNLTLGSVEVQGRGFEVVPAYEENELASAAVYAAVADNTPQMQAGNHFGVGDGRAVLPLAQLLSPAERGHIRRLAPLDKIPMFENKQVDKKSKRGAPTLDVFEKDKFRALWSAPASPVQRNRVQGAFVVAGLSAAAATGPAARAAVERALRDQMSAAIAGGVVGVVRVTGVAAPELEAAGELAAKVDFEVEPLSKSPALDMDRIEAHLILLGLGLRASASFDVALGAALAALPTSTEVAAVGLPGALRAHFAPPHRMGVRTAIQSAPATQESADTRDRKLRGAP